MATSPARTAMAARGKTRAPRASERALASVGGDSGDAAAAARAQRGGDGAAARRRGSVSAARRLAPPTATLSSPRGGVAPSQRRARAELSLTPLVLIRRPRFAVGFCRGGRAVGPSLVSRLVLLLCRSAWCGCGVAALSGLVSLLFRGICCPLGFRCVPGDGGAQLKQVHATGG